MAIFRAQTGKERSANGRRKVRAVMSEFKKGTLRSRLLGLKVKSRKQAVAIAMSEGSKAARRRA